jgi:hypothetical protein
MLKKSLSILMAVLMIAAVSIVSVSASGTGYNANLALPDGTPSYVPAHTFNVFDNSNTGGVVESEDEDGNYVYQIPILDTISVTVNGVTRTGQVEGAVLSGSPTGYSLSYSTGSLTLTTPNVYSAVAVNITFSIRWDDDITHVNTTTAKLTISEDE